jgi:hypothetical protein
MSVNVRGEGDEHTLARALAEHARRPIRARRKSR